MFFVVGSIMLYIGIMEYLYPELSVAKTSKYTQESMAAPLEKMLLGLILFIPGSYHTVAAFMAWQRLADFTYDDVSAFESDDWHDKDN